MFGRLLSQRNEWQHRLPVLKEGLTAISFAVSLTFTIFHCCCELFGVG